MGERETQRMPAGVYDLFKKARVLEAIPYALKGSVDAVLERQTQDLKGVDVSKIIDNSLVDQLVKEKYFEAVFFALEKQKRAKRRDIHHLMCVPRYRISFT